VRAHAQITERHLKQPYYYRLWYCCTNQLCRTTLIMPEREKVYRSARDGDRLLWGDAWWDAIEGAA
jgi:hypothetical protein